MRVLSPLCHTTLNGTLRPKSYDAESSSGKLIRLLQYRDLKYGHIAKRFDHATPVNDYEGQTIECTNYGPRCPQNHVDVGSLLRIPKDVRQDVFEHEDELECLNLVVTLPEGPACDSHGKLPVVIWIHGGSQTVSFVSAASGVCDPSLLVADAAESSKPLMFISLNYRLNIFGFGNLDGESYNLGLRDQQLAINWVRNHVSGFGGDPENITLAGESAGAFCIHAQTLLLPKGVISRAIMQSGHLWTSPPQPLARGQALVKTLRAKVHEISTADTLETLSVHQLLLILKDIGLKSVWNHEQPGLEDWERRVPNVEVILMGDCGHEGSLFAHNMTRCPPAEILAAFKPLDSFKELLSSYHIEVDRPMAAITGALDLLADVRFSWSGHRAATAWKSQTAVVRYVFDEPNPWQSSALAHHAVDLLFLFGTYQKHFPPTATKLSLDMRQTWINFITAESPESMPDVVFGPHGRTEAMQQKNFSTRRRTAAWQVLDRIGFPSLNVLTGALGAGKISLES